MSLRFDTLVIDAHDPLALGRWWAELLGWGHEVDEDDDVVVTPPEGTRATELLFQKVPEDKAVKNRLHLDLRPDDQAAEVTRAEELGARRIDICQDDDVTWVVLADPEGNEFCILQAKPS
jgi:predicted enzyme related to lactoylglutathione lyase